MALIPKAPEVIKAPEDTTPPAITPAAPAAPTQMFQQYNAARTSMKMLTDIGVPIIFVNGIHITKDKDVIKYLDAQIAAGLRVITKGEPVSSAKIDPMAEIKKRAVEEYIASQAAIKIHGQGANVPSASGILTTTSLEPVADE